MADLLHVLALCDTTEDCDMLAQVLQQAGFDVAMRCATTEVDYLAELAFPPDLIVADNTLPLFDTLRAVQLLRANDLDIPLIMLTDVANEASALMCIGLGAADYLFKDRLGRLRSAIERALEQHQLRVQKRVVEAALRESEERFRAIFEYSPDAVILIDPHHAQGDWPIIDCNVVACNMNGYTRDDLIGCSIDILNTTSGNSVGRAGYLERLRRERTIRYETIHQRKDGSLFPVEVVSSLITMSGRELILGLDRDITERKHIQDELRAAEARYRTLVEQLPAIIYTAEINEQSSTRYVSPQIETMLGFSQEEWLANPDLWLEQVYPDDRAQVLEAVNRVQTSDALVPLEYRTFTRDGRVLWLRDAARVVRDETGQPLFMQGITLDITEQKLAQEALYASIRLYRTLASNFPNGAVVLFDHELRFTIADGAGLTDLGLTPQRLEGHTFWEIYPPEAQLVNEPIFRAALAGTPTIREVTSGDLTLVMHTLPVRDEHGAITAGMIMTQDITERKRMEVALINERAQLAQRVDERTADLSLANAELVRAAQLKDEFLASMSHELRTPLNVILGLSESLSEQIYGPLNDRQMQKLAAIEASGRHLLDLINDILDLAKIGAGMMDLMIEPVLINSLCQASIQLMQQAAYTKRLAVTTRIDPAVVQIQGDIRRLKQILINLLANAVKFTPAGGAIGLEVIGDSGQNLVHFTVWDTGIGIAENQLPKLFQPFVQLDSRLSRQYEGTGLGLALVARLAELHGGSVAVASTLGLGSRFTITLPWNMPTVEPDPMMPTHADAPTATPPIDTKPVILLAEDNAATITTLSDYLMTYGYQVVIARNGNEAIAQIHETHPAIVLMDIQMPVMDGLEAIRRIRADNRWSHMPIIALTALAMPGDREQCLAAGADAYLTKPIRLKELAATINGYIRKQNKLDNGELGTILMQN
ncbi:MAG: PAS domain S-box protein [Roseiflexaceae bacterium]|nr:PAS domain S-box protein [Roseiflexaceae bacterium]